MLTIYPQYYKDFQCIGSECILTCCQDWNLPIDELTFQKYQEIGESIVKDCKAIDNSFYFKKTPDGNCSMLDDNGLCRLISEYGPSILCDTCNYYPRQRFAFPDHQEMSMVNSCPTVLKLLSMIPTPMIFLSSDETDFNLTSQLSITDDMLYARDFMIDLIQIKDVSLSSRLFFLLKFNDELQITDSPTALIKTFSDSDYLGKLYDLFMSVDHDINDILNLIRKLYNLVNNKHSNKNSYKTCIAHLQSYIGSCVTISSIEIWNEYCISFSKYEAFFENYFVNHIYSTLTSLLECNLSYDETQLICIEYALIKYTLFFIWINNDHTLSIDDVICISAYYPHILDNSVKFHTEFLRDENWKSRFSTSMIHELISI